ncbi:MAG: helix-turn-helix transcriptional regulator, partial [Methylococcales bacterium]|nr:helix-turn-helix transcriptional regulator [Methylococcales bacterium]
KMGMSVNGYAKIERGETKTHNPKLPRIVETLGLSLTDLFNTNDSDANTDISTTSTYSFSSYSVNNQHISSMITASASIALEFQSMHSTNVHLQETVNNLKEKLAQKEAEISYLKEVLDLAKR